MNEVSTRFHGKDFIEVMEGGYYDSGQEQHSLLHDEDGMRKDARPALKSQEAPSDEMKQAADEAAKAAQEAAKAAAEASQNLMKGFSSFGGGFLGGGNKQQKSGGGGLLGGFGFGSTPAAPAKPAQKQQAKVPVNNQKVTQQKTEPKKVIKPVPKAITAEDLEKKPFTAAMTSRQRWYWSFRMIQQVKLTSIFHCIADASSISYLARIFHNSLDSM